MAAGHSYRAARFVNTMQRTKVVQTAEKAAMEAVSKRVGNVAAHTFKHPNTVKNSSNVVHGPNFIVSSNGKIFPVPKGAKGPVDVINQAGKKTGTAYIEGGGGVNQQVASIRIMDATPARGNSPAYPKGYIKYENSARQGVDPYSGKTLPKGVSHFALD